MRELLKHKDFLTRVGDTTAQKLLCCTFHNISYIELRLHQKIIIVFSTSLTS